MYKRLLQKPLKTNQSFFLFGPRGTGKTQWVKKTFPNALYLDLLESNLQIKLLASPQRLEKMIPKNFKDWIIIDEVQKIPPLLDEIHRLIEKYRYKFILTGSSSRSLKRKGVNLLAGRALTYKMYPLTFLELKKDFNLEKSLKYGFLPSIYSQNNPKEYLASYIQSYLREEVMQEGLTRNISSFSRFLEIASFSQGCPLNLSEIAREASVNRKVIESYFEIIEDLLLGYRVAVFTKRAKRKMIQHPKFYYFDVGIFRSIRPMGPFDSVAEAEGPSLETLIFQEIKALNDYFDLEYQIYYWRSVNKSEVDFILYGPKGILAIEVKRSQKYGYKDLKGLKNFGKDYPEAKLYFIYMGQRKEYDNNINILPLDVALENLKEILDNN
ncbi:MAG: hypothetical protein K1060chlam1_01415 [Candidatus Anoxychlamydiales bacterium]|nr:hypothetical protein [Candidatus Anoxychlamydiales bacterium]